MTQNARSELVAHAYPIKRVPVLGLLDPGLYRMVLHASLLADMGTGLTVMSTRLVDTVFWALALDCRFGGGLVLGLSLLLRPLYCWPS